MILLEVIDAERRKLVAALSPATDDAPGPSRRHSDPSALPSPPRPSSPRLPDYATSQAEAEKAEEAEKQQAEGILKAAKRKQRRLRRYLVYALVVYLVLSVSIGVPLFVVLRRDAQRSGISTSEKWLSSNLPPPPPPPDWLPPDVSTISVNSAIPISCNDWTVNVASDSGPTEHKLQYSMPLSDTIYVRSNFSDLDDDTALQLPVTGSLHVSVVNGTNATVTVTAKNIDNAFLRDSNVCLMSSGIAWGLNISVPSIAEKGYYFDVLLELPSDETDTPLCNFATYLPLFNQSFDSLDSFTDINTSVQARSILVRGSASSISGSFNASEKLILETILRPITANVSLYNYGYDLDPTQLSVETGNSNISLNVNLQSGTNGTGYCTPIYMTSVMAFNGAINAAYYHDPSVVASTLYVRAINSVEPAHVFVDSVFQGMSGTYDVHTTLADAIVERTVDLDDPAGQGRNRSFQDSYVSTSRAYGWVGWGLRPDDERALQQGQIEIVSSLSPAVLELTEAPSTDFLFISNDSKVTIPSL
ncbi:hypothetical protein A7U60_g3454 [Sanghuangporus baumii]|uniref:Uncharacterized protein n=1 Tax=Sanghuangporus baumii TaxID=108892 RepID=A0A9Q5I0G5_SANBA|nr:hypothetical protein A7U60_g3454 [Sanghuangporus baumii]